MQGFTIISEFPHYGEEVFEWDDGKFQLFYKEALRVRASKFTFLAQLINLPNMKKDGQAEMGDYLKRLLHPHILTKNVDVDDKVIESGWAALRGKRGMR
jgi:hypothetical protein